MEEEGYLSAKDFPWADPENLGGDLRYVCFWDRAVMYDGRLWDVVEVLAGTRPGNRGEIRLKIQAGGEARYVDGLRLADYNHEVVSCREERPGGFVPVHNMKTGFGVERVTVYKLYAVGEKMFMVDAACPEDEGSRICSVKHCFQRNGDRKMSSAKKRCQVNFLT